MLELVKLFPITSTIYVVIVVYLFVKYKKAYGYPDTDPEFRWAGRLQADIVLFFVALLWPLNLPYLRAIPVVIGTVVSFVVSPLILLIFAITGGLKDPSRFD